MEALTLEELKRLLAAAKAESERDWLMMLVTYWHGLRASEVTALKPDAIDHGAITVKRLKGSMRTTHPLIEHADPLLDEKKALIDYARKSKSAKQLFPISRRWFYKLVHRYGVAAGIPKRKAHPHALKHSIAMHTIRQAGVENVRQYLGHVSGASTMEYLRVNDDDASAAIAAAVGARARP